MCGRLGRLPHCGGGFRSFHVHSRVSAEPAVVSQDVVAAHAAEVAAGQVAGLALSSLGRALARPRRGRPSGVVRQDTETAL